MVYHLGFSSFNHMTQLSKQHQLAGLIGCLLLCFAASYIGAVGSFQAPTFYARLTQPDWAPPAWLFGPVWTVLYAMMAVALWLVWRQGGIRANRKALAWFVWQLVLNSLWSWVFFAWQMGPASFINIMLLWLSIVITMWLFWPVSRLAAALLLPYLLWVSFASLLNFAMWQLNPDILG